MTIFRPDEMEIGTEEDGRRVILTFRSDNGEIFGVSLTRAHIATTVARLMQETEVGSMVPINRGSLRPGASFSAQGFQVQQKSDGIRLLTIVVDMPEDRGVVTIPLELSPVDTAELIKMLQSPLVQDN